MDDLFVTYYTAVLLLAYLLGSIPWGLVLTRLFTNIDLLKAGSGNIGATNVRRLAGNTLGLLTLLADALKGALPVAGAVWLQGRSGEADPGRLALVALAAVVGHMFPVSMGFKNGGKGVATAGGGVLVISPVSLVFCLTVFSLTVWRSRRVSMGSLAAAGVMPFAVGLATRSPWALILTLFMSLLIVVRHKDNIKRIRAGTEPRI